jgi:phage terminase large subunit-like protein
VIETDAAGNRKPTKPKSIDRIDGIVSAIMACGAASMSEKKGASIDEWLANLAAARAA